jgi:phosphate/sulfate permease
MDFYLILVVILLATAVVDLIVGVSNDAVNFLNSAIGSKVASFKVILTIASIGILAGSLFSSGLMEVARSGIFNPDFFSFERVIIVFLAVMLTDIILLDFFNSLGLPTSSTVSLVFELLGAALATGLLISFDRGQGFETWPEIINYSSAVTIIFGIFLSVILSFIIGSVVQHLARIIFTFKLKKTLKRYGAIFSGLSTTAIVYFLLIKGAKGSSFITNEQVDWISNNTWMIMLISILFWTILIQVLMWWKEINPLKVVVLLGTFSLAMAFAGNDLVNFIGVPVAGLISYQAWTASGILASEFTMGILKEDIVTPSWILMLGGIVMVVTLWTNAKSRKVTETEVTLGRQDEGDERFKPNLISRTLVGSAMWVGRQVEKILPVSWSKNLAFRFEKEIAKGDDQVSFDLIRASINLVVASVLIAYGTSNKLPLSTTFVTFMVAMGSSFADQAWGRESAVYRVAGVINVIAGWLITAVMALLSSALLAFIMYKTGMIGAFGMTTIAAFLLVRSHIVFNRKQKKERTDNRLLEEKELNIHKAISESKNNTAQALKTINQVIVQSLRALLKEDEGLLRKSGNELEKLRIQNEKFDSKIIKYVRKMEKGNLLTGRLYILVFNLMQDLYQSSRLVNEVIMTHIVNHHSPPKKKYAEWMVNLERGISDYTIKISEHIASGTGVNAASQEEQKRLTQFLNKSLDELVLDIQKDDLGNRMGLLLTRVLLEMRDIVVELGELHAVYDEHAKPVSVN